jgi:hypothetical protein
LHLKAVFRGGSLHKKAQIDSTVLAMLLVAGTIWYYYGHPELGSTRAASFLAAYKSMGAESPPIHHERVQLHGDRIHAARMILHSTDFE